MVNVSVLTGKFFQLRAFLGSTLTNEGFLDKFRRPEVQKVRYFAEFACPFSMVANCLEDHG